MYLPCYQAASPQGESPVFQASERALHLMLEVLAEEGSRIDGDVDGTCPNWSLAMMERMFARRPELETYAWRIQGAV